MQATLLPVFEIAPDSDENRRLHNYGPRARAADVPLLSAEGGVLERPQASAIAPAGHEALAGRSRPHSQRGIIRAAMDDATIRDFMATVSEQILILDRNLANLRAAVIVLQAIAALQMAPDDPMEAAKQLQNLEKMLLESDPKSQERKEVAEIIAAVKLLKKRRGGKQNDS